MSEINFDISDKFHFTNIWQCFKRYVSSNVLRSKKSHKNSRNKISPHTTTISKHMLLCHWTFLKPTNSSYTYYWTELTTSINMRCRLDDLEFPTVPLLEHCIGQLNCSLHFGMCRHVYANRNRTPTEELTF